jgi:hypothetical protein
MTENERHSGTDGQIGKKNKQQKESKSTEK